MKHRKLRIAWSVAWGVVAVLLGVLWVRSYWQSDYIEGSLGGRVYLDGESEQGQLWIAAYPCESSLRWKFDTIPIVWTNTRSPDFAFETGPFGFLAFVPHYALILFPAACAALPWLRWRFSLRTLLIVTTLVVVALGLIVWAWRQGSLA